MSDENFKPVDIHELFRNGMEGVPNEEIHAQVSGRIGEIWTDKNLIYRLFAVYGCERSYIQAYIHGMANLWYLITLNGLPEFELVPDEPQLPEALSPGEWNLNDLIGPLDAGDTLETESEPEESHE